MVLDCHRPALCRLDFHWIPKLLALAPETQKSLKKALGGGGRGGGPNGEGHSNCLFKKVKEKASRRKLVL